MVRINDAAQALLQSKIDPLDTTTIDDSLPSSSSSTTEKQHQTPVAVVAKVVAAVKEGDLDQLRFHAKHIEDFTQLRDSEGMPLLHVATSVDNVEVMDLLVVLGCDLNGLDERGGTAVLEAASVGSLRAMKWLVKEALQVVPLAPMPVATRRCIWPVEKVVFT